MALDKESLNLSRWEAQLFERREQIDVVKKGLYQTAGESVMFIALLIFVSQTLSKGWVVAAFSVYIGLVCLVRICFGLSVIGYKKIICKLMERLDKKSTRD